MKIIKALSATLCLNLLIGTYVFAQDQSTVPNQDTSAAAQAPMSSLRLVRGSRYMVNTISPLTVLGQNGQMNDGSIENQVISLMPNNEFDVLEISADGSAVRIGLDVEMADGMSSDLTVSTAELMAVQLSLIEVIDNRETSDLDLRREGLFAARKKRGGMTYCYRDVKTTLLQKGICDHYASGVRAEEGLRILQNECNLRVVRFEGGQAFLNSLPVNSVCVSSGGRPCGRGLSCGHIAVKVQRNGPQAWFGAGYRGTPFLPNSAKPGYKPRKIVGCLVPQ